MIKEKYWDDTGNFFSFSGFILSKLQYIPFTKAPIFGYISLAFYLIGYAAWCGYNFLRPEDQKQENKWYGFAKIKAQFLFSSLIGFTATVVSIAAIFIPFLYPSAAWLFLLANIFWAIGEYHKLKTPPNNDENYFSYILTTTVISLVTAITATLSFVFPIAALPIFIFSLLIYISLGALALEFLLNSKFDDPKPVQYSESYFKMNNKLGPDPTCASKNNNVPVFSHGKNFFEVPDIKELNNDIKTLSAQPSSNKC
ncbi:hypothetical protein [Legionella sp.]|uniref:hypothetical protein n=1 Tax=Legionella sp. TaxID=459 RepID=UPI003CA34E33